MSGTTAGAARVAKMWDELASRTRLASCGAEMRALHGEARLGQHLRGPAEVPVGQLEILERGARLGAR